MTPAVRELLYIALAVFPLTWVAVNFDRFTLTDDFYPVVPGLQLLLAVVVVRLLVRR